MSLRISGDQYVHHPSSAFHVDTFISSSYLYAFHYYYSIPLFCSIYSSVTISVERADLAV